MEALFSLASISAGATPPNLSMVQSQLADTHDTAGIVEIYACGENVSRLAQPTFFEEAGSS